MYLYLILPLVSGLIAQISKLFIKSNRQEISFKNISAYSGMPSGHSAIIISLAAFAGLKDGLASPLFALSVILSIIIIRDALGLRRYIGQHGEFLNDLIKDLKNDQVLERKYPHLLEKIGHTPAQIIVGGLIGFLISWLGYTFLA